MDYYSSHRLAVLIFTGLRAWNDITAPAAKDAEAH